MRRATFAAGPVRAGLLTLLVVVSPSPSPAPAQPRAAADSAPVRRGVADRAELEAFLDGVMTAHLRDKHVAGATVSLVKDGALFFAKGYGYADVAARKPVDPERTLFRIGSVSKLFTWTAVMQLVEAGKLDLETDVNTYLDFRIPATYPEPITLRHLLTHTPGFEEDSRDLFTEDPARIAPLGDWLATHRPARVRPPGVFSSYSNYGTALAGYIVERVSGMLWDDYLDRRILEPLGMVRATGRQPLPERLSGDMSVGYAWEGGRYVAKKWEIITGASPAGSLSASATDMATWMLAHLGRGALGPARLLAEPTAERMQARSFGHDDRLPGWALGFYEKSSHGLRIIGHGGDTRWFHSDLALIPSEGLGVFVSYNTDTGGALSFGPFLDAFLDHYYPEPLPPLEPPSDFSERAGRFAGTYVFNRMSYTTFQKIGALASAIPVRVGDDSTLVVAAALPGGTLRLVEVDSLLFREVNGGMRVAFRADPSGRITHGFLEAAPMMAMERLAWYQLPALHYAILGLGGVTFVGAIVAACGRWLRRRRGGPGTAIDAPPVVRNRRALLGAAVANLTFVVSLALLASDPWALLTGPLTGLKVALAFPLIALGLVLAGSGFTAMMWRRGLGTRWQRLRATAAVVIGLLFAWSLNTWNLLGWRL
jgi:CubicO group peptidase (beta-lactamase class C family)